MRQTKVDHVLNGLADLVVKHERTIATQAKIIEVLRQGLEHYADESFFDDPLNDSGYANGTLYNFEDEIDGQIPGYTIAQTILNQAKEIETT
jgi:hypothetical protein